MKRSSRSRRRKVGFRRVLASPLTPVLIGLAIVLGVGYWAMRDTPPKAPEKAPANTPSATGGKSAPVVQSVTNQPGAPLAEKPADQPATEPASAASDKPGEAAAAEPTTTEPTASAAENTPTPAPAAPVETAPASRSQIDRSGGAAETMLMTVYYADGLNSGLSLQPVEIKVPRSTTPVRETVEQLLNPPTALGLHSNFPPGTRPLGFNLKDGTAIVDLSPEVAEVRGTAAVNTIMASLVYSLTEIPEVDAVQLWVNGSPAVLDGIDWSGPLTREDVEARNLFHVEPVITYSGS